MVKYKHLAKVFQEWCENTSILGIFTSITLQNSNNASKELAMQEKLNLQEEKHCGSWYFLDFSI